MTLIIKNRYKKNNSENKNDNKKPRTTKNYRKY